MKKLMQGLLLLTLIASTQYSKNLGLHASRSIASVDKDEQEVDQACTENGCDLEKNTQELALKNESEKEVQDSKTDKVDQKTELTKEEPKSELISKHDFDQYVCDSQKKMDDMTKTISEFTKTQGQLLNIILGLNQMMIGLFQQQMNQNYGLSNFNYSYGLVGQNQDSARIDMLSDKLMQEYVNLTQATMSNYRQPSVEPSMYYMQSMQATQPMPTFSDNTFVPFGQSFETGASLSGGNPGMYIF